LWNDADLECAEVLGQKHVPMSLYPLQIPKEVIRLGSIVDVRVHTTEKHLLTVNKSLYRPGQTLGVPGSSGSQVSRPSAYEDGKVVSPTHRTPLPSMKYSWYSFLSQAESNPGP